MKRKILALLLALAMVLSLVPFTPLSALADAAYDYALASPYTVVMNFHEDYTAFEVSLSELEGINPDAGQHLTLFLSGNTLSDGTHSIPLQVYNVSGYGTETEHLVGNGNAAEALFCRQTDAAYCAVKIPAGNYEPGIYTGWIYYTSEFWIEDYHSELGDDGNIPVTLIVPEKQDITIGETRHGSVSAGGSSAYVGSTVSITATPESRYYELASISVTSAGSQIALTENVENTQFSFVMPDAPVTINATFRAKGIAEIYVHELAWDGFERTDPFTKGEDGLLHYDLRVEGEIFEDEYALLPYKRYDIQILIDGEDYVEDDPINRHTQNYYYLFDSAEELHLTKGDGYDDALSARPMVLVASQKGVYHFTLDPGERTLTITHTFDDPDAEAYAYALGFQWMDEIPYPLGNAHEIAGTENSYGFGDPIEEEDIYDFEGEETVWMSTEVYGGETIVDFFIGREGKTYGDKTLIHNVASTGQLRELKNYGEECRLKPDFDEGYDGVYDLFFGLATHKLMVFRRSVKLIYSYPGYYQYGPKTQPRRGTSADGITIDREGTIYSGDKVTLSTPEYRENGRIRFAGWYNTEGFSWDEDTGEPWGDCVSCDAVYTFAPVRDTSLYAIYTEIPFDDGYYLIGPNGWTADAIDRTQHFEENPGNANEYMLVTTLAEGSEIKVVRVENGAVAQWYPDPGDNYTVDAAHAGLVTIYFKTSYDSAWSAFGGHIYIEPIYTVTLVPGDGSGEPIVYHSNEGTIAAAWNNAQNCQFYIENDGSIAFRLDPDYCPDTFTAPEGYEFDTWSNANRYIPLTARETTITALWKESSSQPTGPASITFSPTAYELEGSSYTDIPFTIDTLMLGLLETELGEMVAESVGLEFYGGTLSDGAGHEIPFLVDLVWHFGPEDSTYAGGFGPEDKNFVISVWIEPEDFAAAPAGTYTGVMNYNPWWRYNGEMRMQGETGTFALTLTIDPAPAEPLFAAHNLVLSGQIGVNFFMDLSALSDEQKEDSYMTFSISGAGDVSEEPVYFDPNRTDPDGLYHKFTCYVNAIQMADTITATYHWFEGGVEKTTAIEYSVKRYILDYADIQDAYDFETTALVHALADYGHFVQIFLSAERGWELDTDYAVMDEFFTEEYDFDAVKAELADYAGTKTDETNGDLAGVSFSLVLDSETAIWVYFTPSAAYTGTPTVTIDWTEYIAEKKGGRYAVVIADIPANRLGDSKTIVFTTANGSATVELSALSYVKAAMDVYTNMDALNAMAAIYNYAKAAEFYADTH